MLPALGAGARAKVQPAAGASVQGRDVRQDAAAVDAAGRIAGLGAWGGGQLFVGGRRPLQLQLSPEARF